MFIKVTRCVQVRRGIRRESFLFIVSREWFNSVLVLKVGEVRPIEGFTRGQRLFRL